MRIGHEERWLDLMRALNHGRLGHAYLFIGPASVGKTFVAMEFAKAILCMERVDGEACGSCRSCLLFDHGNHPDFRMVNPDGTSLKIEQIRSISKEAGYLPVLSERKVFFVGDATLMTDVAANGFLKTLEEPPSSVVFLSTADDENSVLPTIRSRFQGVRLGPVLREKIIEGLVHRGCDVNKAVRLAEQSRGLPGLAIRGFETEETDGWAWGQAIEDRDLMGLLRKAAETEKLSREQAEVWLHELDAYYRGRLTMDSKYNLRQAYDGLKAIETARIRLAANVNARLIFEGLFLKLCG